MKQITTLSCILFIIFAIHGCGGGNSGSDTSPPATSSDDIAINRENAKTLALQAYSIVNQVDEQRNISGTTKSANALNHSPHNLTSPAALSQWAIQLANHTHATPHASLRSATTRKTISDTTECDISGSTKITLTSSNPGEITPGDKLTFRFNNCDDGDGSVLNGTLILVYNEYQSDENYSVTMKFDAAVLTSEENNLVQGDMTVTLETSGDITTTTVSSPRFYTLNGNEASTLENMRNTQIEGGLLYVIDYDTELTSDKIGGKVEITTEPKFRGNITKPYPNTGVMTVTGANNTSVQLNADTGSNATAFLTINDGSAITSEEIFWRELETL